MTEQILKQEVMIDGQQVLSIATPDIVNNHVSQTAPHTAHAVETASDAECRRQNRESLWHLRHHAHER